MYHNYPNLLRDEGQFTPEDTRQGMIALHTDYECPFCQRWQSVAQMGGYGADCIQCGESSNPSKPRKSNENPSQKYSYRHRNGKVVESDTSEAQ